MVGLSGCPFGEGSCTEFDWETTAEIATSFAIEVEEGATEQIFLGCPVDIHEFKLDKAARDEDPNLPEQYEAYTTTGLVLSEAKTTALQQSDPKGCVYEITQCTVEG